MKIRPVKVTLCAERRTDVRHDEASGRYLQVLWEGP